MEFIAHFWFWYSTVALACWLKGKWLAGSVALAALPIGQILIVLVRRKVDGSMPLEGYGEGLLILLLVTMMFVVGLIGAVRLARPGSWWANRYDERKTERATSRYGSAS